MAFSNQDDVYRALNLAKERLSTEGITEAQVTSHLEVAEEEVELYLGTKFSIQGETAYLDGKGTPYLMLPRHPVNRIIEIAVDWNSTGEYTAISSARYGWKSNGMLFIRKNAISHATVGVWPRGAKSVKVIYEYGNSTAPKAVQELTAVIAAIKIMVALSGGKYNSFSAYSLGKLSTSNSPEFIGKSIERLNAEKERLLASYGRPIRAIVNA